MYLLLPKLDMLHLMHCPYMSNSRKYQYKYVHQHLLSPCWVMSKAPFCLPAQKHEHVSQLTVALKIR